MKRITDYLLVLTLLTLASGSRVCGIPSEVQFMGGASDAFLNPLNRRLTTLVSAFQDPATDYSRFKSFFTEQGFASFQSLMQRAPFVNLEPKYEPFLARLQDGSYEARSFRVRLREDTSSAAQHLILRVDRNGAISDAYFGISDATYQKLRKAGEAIKDESVVQTFLNILEQLQTAYCNKDSNFLDRVYKDDALVIVGRVIQEAPPGTEVRHRIRLNPQDIVFLRESGKEYTDTLKEIFRRNAEIRVELDSLRELGGVIRHPATAEEDSVYGLNVFQRWRSSRYDDDGYLFLCIQKLPPVQGEPSFLIIARAWQPRRFSNGRLITVTDIDVLPKLRR